MNDLISRQAAIDALTLNAGWKDEEGRSVEDWDERKKIWTDLISLIPSAQPENKELAAWKEDFQEYIKLLNLPRDDYKGIMECIDEMPTAQPDLGKYEYHYDHTDCIWYRPEARNRCPVTCAQYRDGWNDAMNYIFKGGAGYRPYRREQYYERRAD